MPKWCCKHCGMITDEPEIKPLPDKDKEFREMARPGDYYVSRGRLVPGVYAVGGDRYNHSITCPVCLNETRFWREEPFPADK